MTAVVPSVILLISERFINYVNIVILRKMVKQITTTKKLKPWGSSTGVLITKDDLEALGVDQGDFIRMIIEQIEGGQKK